MKTRTYELVAIFHHLRTISRPTKLERLVRDHIEDRTMASLNEDNLVNIWLVKPYIKAADEIKAKGWESVYYRRD